jgi:hypothetical protein
MRETNSDSSEGDADATAVVPANTRTPRTIAIARLGFI